MENFSHKNLVSPPKEIRREMSDGGWGRGRREWARKPGPRVTSQHLRSQGNVQVSSLNPDPEPPRQTSEPSQVSANVHYFLLLFLLIICKFLIISDPRTLNHPFHNWAHGLSDLTLPSDRNTNVLPLLRPWLRWTPWLITNPQGHGRSVRRGRGLSRGSQHAQRFGQGGLPGQISQLLLNWLERLHLALTGVSHSHLSIFSASPKSSDGEWSPGM